MSDHRSPLSDSGPRRLNLVLPGHELSGHAPLAYEKLTKTARPGSAEHRGLLATAQALARQAALRCLPPSARSHLAPALSAMEAFVAGGASLSHCEKLAQGARASTFAALPALETLTLDAVSRASQVVSEGQKTSLHDHASHTLGRMVGLSVHHAVAALCHALDGIQAPASALAVPSDACGAIAYSRTALGSARSPTFQAAAIEQARWEHERAPRQQSIPRAALEVQVFHEYLGARWRAHADQERRASDEFIGWALGFAPA